MGNIKTTFVKRIGRELYEKHGEKFTEDYTKNKEIMAGLADISSKKLRNVVAGYITNLKKQNNDK